MPFVEFGQYRLIEKLGAGAMGEVYKPQHVSLGKIVAVKLLAVDRVKDATLVERFRLEMKAVTQLDHHHIVRARKPVFTTIGGNSWSWSSQMEAICCNWSNGEM